MKRKKGFTLIEMLIAMTLLSVMVVLLFSSLNIAAESWNAGEHKVVQVNKKAVVYQFFKRHLTTVRPVMEEETEESAFNGAAAAGKNVAATADSAANANDSEGAAQLTFRGQRQAMRFVAALPAASARKGLQVFEIMADSKEPSTIMVTLSPFQQTEPGEPEPVVLLEHVKDFAFSYFGKKGDPSEAIEARWHDEWKGADRLPQLIKVGIELDDGSYWPDMVFPLKITNQVATDAIVPEEENQLDEP